MQDCLSAVKISLEIYLGGACTHSHAVISTPALENARVGAKKTNSISLTSIVSNTTIISHTSLWRPGSDVCETKRLITDAHSDFGEYFVTLPRGNPKRD